MRQKLQPWIRREAIHRFLHVRENIDENLESMVQQGLDTVFTLATFRSLTRKSALLRNDGVLTLDGVIPLPYDSLRHRFAKSDAVYIVVCTLGSDVMRQIQRRFLTDPAEAVVLDACASAVTDAFAGYLQSRLPEPTTRRFSPGYGDVPLALQRELFHRMDVSKGIGVYITEGDLMIPEKSVLFLAGNHPEPDQDETCADCSMDCSFRREAV